MTTTNKSRRTLLKSIAAGGGAVVAGKSLPDTWKKPVIDSVMLPAHAQTSGEFFSGLYSTQNSFITRADGTGSGSPAQVAKGLGRRLLDWVVPAAHADHVLAAICANEYNLVFEIPPGSGTRTVQICVDTSQSRTSATTSITGNSLSNVTIPLLESTGGGCEFSDEELVLTNMTVGSNGVSGNLQAVEDGDEIACNNSFLAEPTAGSFSCSETCFDAF